MSVASAAERDFSNFELGDNVYELADGLIPEIAARLGFLIGEKPDGEHLYGLVGSLGKNKVLRSNEEVIAINLETAAELLERSGVQKPLNRSLWTPEHQVDPNAGVTILTGAVANWQDRTADLVAEGVGSGTLADKVHIVVGSRVMGKTESEKRNPNVKAYYDEEGEYPTESSYASAFVAPKLRDAGASVVLNSYDTSDGGEIAEAFTHENEDMFKTGSSVTFARVANAGVQLAVQFRDAVRAHILSDYDGYPHSPEVFVVTDSFPIAGTPEEVADPANFQSPYTGLRQAVLTAKLLHETVTA